MTHFNNAVRRIGWWQLCLCLSIFYTTSASAIRVPSATECLAVQEGGGLCLAVPNGNTIAWCASQETLTNTTVAIANVLPATVAQNSTQNIIVTAPNAHFSSESKVRFSNDINVNQVQVLSASQVQVLSASQLQVNITVPPSIPLDMYDILIDTSGEISKGFCLLEVTASQSHAPNEILLSNQVIENDTATDNTVIGNFTTNDVDAGDAHVYRLLEDNSGYFAIDGNQLKVATPRFMIAGEYSILVLATDNLGLALVKSFNVTVSGSRDEDAIPDAIEAKAPNDGDGNNDGKPDDQQSDVASLPLKNGQYLTLVSSNSSCPLQRVKIVTESKLNADENNDYPYDLVSFDYNCAVTSTIYSYYHGLTATGWSVRSYSSIAQQWDEIMQSIIEKVSLPSGETLKVSVPPTGT
ncbi:MAG: cadherin repeat domain-containing protein [Thiotrichaceae bacterium]